jgi:hypothetical protein
MEDFGGRIVCMAELWEARDREIVLKDLYGTTNSYVRGPRGANLGKSFTDIIGRVKMAKDSGATDEEIRDAILRGITDPPNAIPERVEETRGRFLS